MQVTPSALAKFFLILCFALTSCKETESMKKAVETTHAEIKKLQEETAGMDNQMIELRKLLPVSVVSEPLIKQFTAKLANEILGIENEITRVKTSLLEAQTQLAKAQKDLETLRGLSN
jgi:septal ring factor EnvC (AmiA/AmiB activator)